MKKIAIIGAGISGLYIANLFKGNKDYQVTIYEKKTSLEIEEGYGIQLSVNSVKLLNKLGFSSLSEKEKFNPKKIDFYEIKNLKKICDLDISKFNSDDCKYTTLKRSKLLQFLTNGLDENTIQFNCTLENIEYSNDSINFTFNKEKITCDHLIISDGVFSKGKSLISNNKLEPIYNNTIAVRGSISIESIDNINEENISLFLGSDFHYVLYPLNDDKNFNFIGILKNKLNPDQQKNRNLCSESSFIESINHKLSEKMPTKFFQSLEDIKLFPVFVSKNPFNPPKNIYFVGDAFFAFSPSFAQGASQSIEGANQLHEIIINKKNDFYNTRLDRVKMIYRRSDLNQFAFHLSNPIMIFFRNIFLKVLTKNKKFLQSYLGKIYKS